MSTPALNQWVNDPASAPTKITKRVVAQLRPPASGQAFVRDSAIKGFGLRITASGAISFIVEKRIDGKVRRLTLGRHPEITVEQARREAHKVLGQVALGVNPLAEREHARLLTVTLAQVFEDFCKARKSLKPRTVYDYGRLLKVAFSDWQSRPIANITKDLIVRRHSELGRESGEPYANLALRFLRSLFNFAIAQYEDGFGKPLITENPVQRLTQTRAWFRSERRQTVIKIHQLPAWFAAVEDLRQAPGPLAKTVADYLLVLLFTGLRRQEAAQLTWEMVDLKAHTLYIHDPKNREPLLLPYSNFVGGIFERRRAFADSAFVFPGEGRQGYLIEPKRPIARVIAASGVSFTIHDLRRTFITVAESIDIPPYAIKRMVNHKMRGDVTAGYIISDVERLRAPVNQVSDYLEKVLRLKPSASVISLSKVG